MEVRLLGEVTVVDDAGSCTPLGTGRVAMLVGVLALQPGEPVSNDRLIDCVWPGEPPTRPEHAVRVVVSRARSRLGTCSADVSIDSVAGGYVLRASRSDIDVLRCRDLLADARGAAEAHERLRLAEVALAMSDGREPFAGLSGLEVAETVRRDVREWRGDLCEVWAGAALALGRDRSVIDLVVPLLDEFPYRERIWAVAAEALHRVGRHREAIGVLDRARAVFAEAGLDLPPELGELERRVHARHLDDHRPGPAIGTLPAPVDRFVGRERELSALAEILDHARLITLIGPGGIGKTRLAVTLAERCGDAFELVRWADLSGSTAADGAIESVVAQALGADGWVSGSFARAAGERLGSRSVLLVVDNCEHVVEHAATALRELLSACPTVRVVATSRTALRIAGEHLFEVEPLPVPTGPGVDRRRSADDAIDLFVERARAADRHAEFDETALDDVSAIVRRLDGVPLAIELAASMTATMSTSSLRARIDDDLLAVDARPRRDTPRHQTLDATIRWGYRLLDDSAQRLLRRLAVFPGPFTADDAVALADDDERARRVLDELIEASMIARLDEARSGLVEQNRLLVPIREFALQELRDVGEAEVTLDARDRVVAELFARTGPITVATADPWWRTRIGHAATNARATIERSLERGRHDAAVDTAAVLVSFLSALGRYPEASNLVGALLPELNAVDRGSAGRLLEAALWSAVHRGDYPEARRLAEMIEHASVDVASLHNAVGSLYAELGDLRRARRSFRVAIGESPAPAGLVNLAAIEAWAGRVDEAAVALAELPTADGYHAGHHAVGQSVLAVIARMRGQPAVAVDVLDRCDELLARHASRFHVVTARLERAVAIHEIGDPAGARAVCDDLLADEDLPRFVELRTRSLRIGLDLEGDRRDASVIAEMSSVLEAAGAMGAMWSLVDVVDLVAVHAAARGDDATARRLVAAGSDLRSQLEVARDPWERRRLGGLLGDDHHRGAPQDTIDVDALIAVVRAALVGATAPSG